MAEAEALYRRNLTACRRVQGPGHPDTLAVTNILVNAYKAAGLAAEAVRLREETRKLLELKLGTDDPRTLQSRGDLVVDYSYVGRYAEAVALRSSTLQIQEDSLGRDHPQTLQSRSYLAVDLRLSGRTAEAIDLLEPTLKLQESKLGPGLADTIYSRNALVYAYESLGRWPAAETLRRDAVAFRRDTEKPDSPLLAGDLSDLGHNLLKQSKWTDAEPVFRECVVIREKVIPGEWRRFNAKSKLGGALLGQGRYAEAEPLVVSGYEGLKAREAKILPQFIFILYEAEERVVRLYEAWGKPDQAKAWASKLALADLPADVFARP